jgi:hypothetical protein
MVNQPQTIFTTQLPSDPNASDNGDPYELGMKFQSSKPGQITAIRFWKANSETGSHVGKIWSSTGSLLTQVNFSKETESGWQNHELTTPLIIQANTNYIVSYNSQGYLGFTVGGLANSVVNGDLSSVADGNNGVFGSPNAFPTHSFQNSNYFVDIVFLAEASTNPMVTHPIYLENKKAGTEDWKILCNNRARNEIAGFAGATSVNQGEALPIKVSLAEPGNFTVDVYRLGYYGGKGGRLVMTSGSLPGITQPPCTIDSQTRLVECQWSTSYTIPVGTDWTSGMYVAKLTDSTTGKQSEVWFVVRDDSSISDIVMQLSFNTYQAYNKSNGYSLYSFNSLNGQRAFKVSFDRPFSQTSALDTPYDMFTRWERLLMRWLESQSYDVSYITNMDVHANGQLLQQHKVFISASHDEYWSMEARNNVEEARDGNPPLNLVFLSANTCYWRVHFEDSSTGEPNRIMACYKENWAQYPVAPTNKFRSLENNRPENALLGVMYTGDNAAGLYDTWTDACNPTFSGYDFVATKNDPTVNPNNSDSYYDNTGLKIGDKLSQLVGFEWDSIVNNGATPSELVILSESPVIPTVTDDDLPPGTNTQVSHAVRYTAPSGAKVFSTGSIHWIWGLDSDGIVPSKEDTRAKQIVINVLADMGAKPLTPSPGIVVP